MGTVLSSKKRDDGKIVFEIIVDYEEATQLKGHMEDVHLFSEKIADIETNIATRGKNEATKYFLIPKKIRKKMKVPAQVSCQKIETPTKSIFIYVVDKVL